MPPCLVEACKVLEADNLASVIFSYTKAFYSVYDQIGILMEFSVEITNQLDN